MKILFVADVPIGETTSGSEVVLHNQVIHLKKNGNDIFAITRQAINNNRKPNVVKGIKIESYYANTSNFFSFSYSVLRNPVKLFDKLYDDMPFQIIISHQSFTFFPLLIRKRIKQTPIIYVFHSPSHEEYMLSKKNKKNIFFLFNCFLRSFIEKYAVKKSNKIMVLSNYMKNRLIKTHNINEEIINVNHGGVDLKHFKPLRDRDSEKKHIGFQKDHIHLLTIRNLEYRMGVDNLVKAIGLIKQKGIRPHLVIGGEGPEKKQIEKLRQELNLRKEITLTGFIAKKKLSQYYGAADFFIIPTRELEGFGLVIPESLACGTPVLGTPVGGIQEILSNFNPKFLFKDSTPEKIADGIIDSINNYFYDKNKYLSLRKKCREHAEKNYSWKRHIDQLMHIISDACRINLRLPN